MTTPQDSPRRKKQKIRRAKQLAVWREAHPVKEASKGATAHAAPKAKQAKKAT